ncbi:MAG: hypothetical protein NTW87_07055 [Planctomycetota bacterium]|nr:hypothetical protein [Planctomycetota bacterium]
MLDAKTGIIHLRATKHYPNLKNEISERDIKPFGNFWRAIAEYKKQATHADLVFPRLWTSEQPAEYRRFKNADNLTWFEDRDGRPRVVNLPGKFADALESSGFKQAKPALRLRHFWVTEMEARGLGHLLDSMGGNSARVRQKHYIRHASVVAAANVPTL